MGFVNLLINTISFIFILLIIIAAPLIDAQTILPGCYFPEFLRDFGKWYGGEFGNYLLAEKPNFFKGLAWIQLLVNWPISLASLYAFIANKPWFGSACLGLGFAFLTAVVAVVAELLGSGRAPERVLYLYLTFLVLDLITILRGILRRREQNTAVEDKKTN